MSDTQIKFREDAIKEHQESPSQLSDMIRIIRPYAWIVSACIYVLLICIVLWSIFGHIPVRLSGQGLLMAEGGRLHHIVAPLGGGYVEKLLVKAGDTIEKGGVIAILRHPNLEKKIQNKARQVTQFKAEYATIEQKSIFEIKKRTTELKTQKAILEKIVQSQSANVALLNKSLEKKRQQIKRGLETITALENAQRDVLNAKQELQQARERINQLKLSETDFRLQWKRQLEDLNIRIISHQRELDDLKHEHENTLTVVSPITGVVIELQTSVGGYLKAGQTVGAITMVGEGMDALIFVSANKGKRVKVDMKALVSPSFVQEIEYGSIHGVVTEVGKFPVSEAGAFALLQNKTLIKGFSKDDITLAVRIRLVQADSKSGFKWTTSKGPSTEISPGTIVSATITVHEVPPITLIIPRLKQFFGIH